MKWPNIYIYIYIYIFIIYIQKLKSQKQDVLAEWILNKKHIFNSDKYFSCFTVEGYVKQPKYLWELEMFFYLIYIASQLARWIDR